MPSDSSSQASKKPIRLGKYEVIRHIATGGMGAVYHARDTETNREVALKILPPDLAAKPAMVVRFRREYAAASKLQHENIVELYELGELNQTLYFAMEFVEGIDLHEHVKKHGPLDPEEARQLILQSARALRHAAQHGIVHRDIKPSNFLLTRKNGKPFVKLTDFGLARETSDDHYRVTRAGTTVGTIDYMSPEQARDSGAADARSDLYSLGGTWFHLLTGQAPFPAGGLGERLIKIMNDPPPDVCALNPRVSPACRTVIERLLAKSPEDRYPTAEALIDDLLSLEGQTTRRPRSAQETRKKSKKRSATSVETNAVEEEPTRGSSPWPWIYAGGGIVLALLVLVGVLISQRRGIAEEQTNNPNPVVVPPLPRPNDPPVNPGPDPKQPNFPEKQPLPGTLPRLGNAVFDPVALKAEIDRPWADPAPWSAPVRKVRRLSAEAGTFRSIADALAAPGPAIVEIADNGPLFELPADLGNRDVWIRAAPGYRPLVLWDLPATQDKRRQEKKAPEPLTFWRGTGRRWILEGIDVAWRIPETLAESFTVFEWAGGEVQWLNCTFSSLGRPRELATLLRIQGTSLGSRVRIERSHLRATGLKVLDLDAPAAEVRLDGSLVVSSDAPLLRLRNGETAPTSLRIVRSTLVGGPRLIELAGRTPEDRKPAYAITAWDSVLACLGRSGDLLTLEGATTDASALQFQPRNVLYAGWVNLFRHEERRVATLKDWRDLWVCDEADGLSDEVWPDAGEEPGIRPASAFAPLKSHGFATSVDPTVPIGHDPKSLPQPRANWLQPLVLEATPVELLEDPLAPEIPAPPGDERFHGARLDLTDIPDLGAYLDNLRRTRKWAERVVLYLTGKGERTTSPLRITDGSLVLVFEEPADKDAPRLALKGTVGPEGALIDVRNGNLELHHATLRLPDLARSGYSHLVRVQKGSLRLHRCRLEGPMQSAPDNYRGAILLESLPPSPGGVADKLGSAEITDSVILSGQRGLSVNGTLAQLRLQHSLIVASEALTFTPGVVATAEGGMPVLLQRTTLAFRRSALLLSATGKGPIVAPVLLRTKDCALLSPFATKPARTALMLEENEAFARGGLIWHSERDALDNRWHVVGWPLGVLPETRENRTAWARLLGSYGHRSPRSELVGLKSIDGKPWAIERLALPGRDAPGANFSRLGLRKP
jgi:serine/threonine protein kinase